MDTNLLSWLNVVIKTNVDATQDTMEPTHRTEVVQNAQRENIINGLATLHLIAISVPKEKRRRWDRPNVVVVLPARMLVVLVYALSVNLDKRRTGD